MAYVGDIYQGDRGKIFRIDTEEDLTNATLVRLEVYSSTGVCYWTPTVTSGQIEFNETAGQTILQYTSTTGQLNLVGAAKIVAYVEWGVNVALRGRPAVIIIKEIGEE